MPKKSWQGRRKQFARSKRKKQRRSPAVVQQQTATSTPVAAVPPGVSVPVAGVSAPKVVHAVAQHPYVVGELKRISILAGAMIVILIVLALVLS